MKHLVLMCLLLYRDTHTTQSEIFNQSVTEGSDAFLYCKQDEKAFWSKDRDGQRWEILSVQHGDIKKYIVDPHNRYSVLSDLSLHIKSVSFSDSGIYYCNTIQTVKLIVTALVTPNSKLSALNNSVNEPKSTQSNTHPQFTSTPGFSTHLSTEVRTTPIKKIPYNTDSTGITKAVSCGAVFVMLVLLICACIKWKAAISNKKEKVNIYETVDDSDCTVQPGPPYLTAVPPQKQNDTVYYLAGDPNIVNLGQCKEIADHTYTLISESESKENLADQGQDEPLYSTIK
ncbi:uncharacterized protein LOC127450477 [Myxocyprinus asiaticus]|uniref:uncharacterized protein LOC127450477 n=1 Tax=Myxocyprinus asiaticus TaxID=70543 RepID=UPI002221CC3E|nr:uncharacterized protein LOC127450477 [Myxocyprinus asiaticus]